jgi:integrase
MASRKRGNSEGSIYQMQDGRWRAAVTIGKDADGRIKRKVFTKPTRHEVADELNVALKNKKDGIPIVIEKQTVAQFLEHWLEHVIKTQVRPKTHRTYSDFVKNHIAPAIGAVPLGKLSAQHVRKFRDAKLTVPAGDVTPGDYCQRRSAGLGPRSVNHILTMLRSALAQALRDGQIPRNVAESVDAVRAPRPKPRAFTREQARAFLDAVRGSRLEAAFTAAVAIGLRQGEILGLKWSELDLEAGSLTVRAALQRVNKKLIQVEPKSESSFRTINLPAVCVSAFAQHKRDQDGWKWWAGSAWRETGYVFTTRVGTPMDPRDLLREYYAITRPKPKDPSTPPPKLGFPAIRFHDLRHSTATLLLAQGVSPKYIAELLGHSNVSFTLQTYAHVLPEVQQQVAAKMDETLAWNGVATTVATKRGAAIVS